MKSPLLLLLTILIAGSELAGQSFAEIRHNELRAWLKSDGQMVAPDGAWMTYEKDGGSFHLNYIAQLLLVGLDQQDSLYVSTGSLSRPVEQIRRAAYPKVWQVSAEEISNHIADFEDDGVIDSPEPAVFAWPGAGNPFFSEYNDGLSFLEADGFTAAYWDENDDDQYNPMDGDYPILDVSGCGIPIVPTQMNWAAFLLRGMESGSDTLVFEGKVNLFTFACAEDNALNDAVFAKYEITNRSSTTFKDMYWSAFADPDIGCPYNDYVGSFPDRFAGFAYNASPQDFPCEQLPAEYTFEDHPLVWGTDVYRGPLQPSGAAVLDVGITYFTKLQEGVPLEMTGPITKEQVYNYVQGNWRDGTPLTAGGTGFGGEEVVDFAFPGLPEQEGGWTEREAGNEPGDRKLLTNYGPFDVMPGATNEFILSYTVFDGPGDHLEKVTGLRDQIDELQAYFDACFEVDGFGMPPCTQVLTDTEEAPGHASMSVRVFPNPAQDLLHIEAGGKPFQFQLLNQFGRLVRQGQTAPLNVQDLPAGVYYLQLQIGQQQMVEKIVLQP